MIGIEPRSEHESTAELHSPEDLDRLLPEADFVVTTVPHTPESEGMWNAERFALMKARVDSSGQRNSAWSLSAGVS